MRSGLSPTGWAGWRPRIAWVREQKSLGPLWAVGLPAPKGISRNRPAVRGLLQFCVSGGKRDLGY